MCLVLFEFFDFECVNMLGEFWFGEGFILYYDDVILVCVGVFDFD